MHIVSAVMFFPRGGSAHVARSLARELPAHGVEVTHVSGSLGRGSGPGDAEAFYRGLDVRAVDFGPALKTSDPLAAPVPMHPSFEDRGDAPDVIFAKLDDAAFERQVEAWAEALEDAGAADADVLHLHHLTPINEAAARVAPGVPVVGSIHGTELLMLEEIAEGPPRTWRHAAAWGERLCAWAQACERLVIQAPSQARRAAALLEVDLERFMVMPNGFDPLTFDRVSVDRPRHWHRHLVENPQGWAPGDRPGSVHYVARDIAPLCEHPVILYVGRFTAVKRLDLLIHAYKRARERMEVPAPLVLLGGHPGEWEGDHPLESIQAAGARDVFLAGWHDHDALPGFLAACDVLVLPSVREQFGQVLVEAMACHRPVIAVDRHGPAAIVDDGETGWLVEPDDEAGLADALVQAINEPEERRRRGEVAYRTARERWSWPALAGTMADLLADVISLRASR